jgi:hypothetical protein
VRMRFRSLRRILPLVLGTEYVGVENAYRYGYLDVRIDGERRTIQPIDHVGENVVGSGRFTYVITVDPATRNPNMTFARDE